MSIVLILTDLQTSFAFQKFPLTGFFLFQIQPREPHCIQLSWLPSLLWSVKESQAFLVKQNSLEEYWLSILQNCHPIYVYLMFFSDQSGIIHFWKEYQRGENPFSPHQVGERDIHSTSIMFTLIAWLRSYSPGFSTAKLLFFSFLSLLFGNESLCLKGGGIKHYFLED